MKKTLLGYYNYTVVLTYCGLLLGTAGICLVMEGRYPPALICLMGAGFCDMFDGAVAATRIRTPQEKCFGIQIDSLTDLVAFGVLPGLFVYRAAGRGALNGALMGLFVLSALIRLAYFNVQEQQRQEREQGARQDYQGVPVTTAALVLPAVYPAVQVLRLPPETLWGTLLAVGLGYLMPIAVPKPRLVGKFALLGLGLTELAGVLYLLGRG